MYAYHNGLTSAHPASSPWWAWPLNLKPVWFYQEGLAGGTSAALYDAGSLVIWWLGIPAMAFVAWMAFKRRSLALTLIAIGFAAQWIPVGPDRPGRLPVPLLHVAAVHRPGPGLLRRGGVAWRLAPHLGAGTRCRRAGDHGSGHPVAARPAAVRVRRGRFGQSGLGRLSGGHPRLRADAADRRPRHRRRRRPDLRHPRVPGVRAARRRGGRPRPADRGIPVADPDRRRGRRGARHRLVPAGHGHPDPDQHPGRADRPDRGDPARLPRRPGLLVARPASVRGRPGGGRRRLVRDPVPEHQRPAAAVGGGQRLPGHPADLPVRLPVPGQHRDPEHEHADLHDDAGGPADRPDRDLPGGRLFGLGLAAGAGRQGGRRGEAASAASDDADDLVRTGGA